MKHFYLFPLALMVAACGGGAPSIDDLKEDSYPFVEQVLTEDDTEAVSHRLHAMGIFPNRTGHMDLNWPQPWFVRLGYAIFGRIAWPFIK